jgi:curved DNA-binding protein CbpA
MNDRQPDAQGDLMRYPFPRLLFYLYKKQLLGELEIAQPGGGMQGRIYFRDGLPVFTDLPFSHDVLGHVLMERGLIDAAAFNASLQELASGEQLQGQILMGMGALDQHGLVEGLRLQLLRKLSRVFPLTSATFAIYSGEHAHGVEGEEAHVQADPLWVIYHGVRNAFDASRMQSELEKLQGKLIGLPAEFQKVWSRYGMGEEMHPLVTLLLRGSMPLEHLYKVTNIGTVLTQMLIYTLWVTEVLVAGDASQRAASRHHTGPMTAVPQAEQPQAQQPQAQQPQAQYAQPVAPQPAQPIAAPPQADRQRHYETAPEVAALAQSFSEIPVAGHGPVDEEPTNPESGAEAIAQSIQAEAYAQARTPQPSPSTEFIVAAPPEAAPATAAPSLGEEGVYEIPMQGQGIVDEPPPQTAPAPAAAAPAPAPPAVKPEAPSNVDAGVAAKHNQLILKNFKRCLDATHYEVLEVPQDAPDEQIREAYFELAKIFHPDRVSSLGLSDVGKEAEDIFRKINEAHSVLTNKENRKAYDEEIESGGSSGEARDAFAAEFVFQKATVHLRKKNYPEALRGFQEAVKLNPKEGEHVGYVAWTLFTDPKSDTSKMLPKLKERLLKAINLSPNSPTCHYFLGEIYLAMGEDRRAFTCFNRVLEINPDHIEASRHIRIIRMRKDKQKKEKKGGGLFGRLTKKK